MTEQHFTHILDERKRQHDSDIENLRRQITSLEKLVDAKFMAQSEAVLTATVAMNARFESVNEFRAALSDQSRTFVTRQELSDIERRINKVENRLSEMDGRVVGWSAGIGLVVLIISITTQFINIGG